MGDRYGALTLAAATVHGLRGLRVHQDGLSGELALAATPLRAGLGRCLHVHAFDGRLFARVKVVLWQLPRSLDEVAEVAELIAAHADPQVQVFAGGRIKHMTLAMNTVLDHHFSAVVAPAGPGANPARCGSAARSTQGRRSSFPRREFHTDLDLWLCSHGATFGGSKVDRWHPLPAGLPAPDAPGGTLRH